MSISQIIVKRRRALPFFGRHPWVFAGAIARIEGEPQPGDEVQLLSHDQQFIAHGLYNPHSNIRVRLYSWQRDAPMDREFWSTRIDQALALRRRLFSADVRDSACRLVYSESDGLSGLIVDRYGEWLIVQFTSQALALKRELLCELLAEKLHPAGIWLRTEKGIREAEQLEISDGLISGKSPPRPLFIREGNVQYGIDIVEGQKTGFFLDQRTNREAITRLTNGHRVLDLFCYSGGFGLHALVEGGAKRVVAVDVSKSAITTAAANAELNSIADRIHFVQADAFDELNRLERAGERFDTVILDPPKMARHRQGVSKALGAYLRLNAAAMRVLTTDGLLVTCSCSGHVDRDQFRQMLAQASLDAGRPVQILESRGQSADHPVSAHCLETDYLKCFICRVA